MALIKSISGFRGTIGGVPEANLTPVDIVKFSAAFSQFIKESSGRDNVTIVTGRDARVSGEMVNRLVVGTLTGMGVRVIDTGLSTTPSVEMAVTEHNADGGIILTASHNPAQWNALKLLNAKGEFINAEEGKRVLDLAAANRFNFATIERLGEYIEDNNSIEKHIDKVIALDLVDVEAIRRANFKVAIDGVCSTGGIVLTQLLERLGVRDIVALNAEPTGIFPHNPEPLPEHITDLCRAVRENKCDVGFVVDPDVDRLAIVCENGEPFVEEYTLVAVADYVLSKTAGNTVSNLSSSRALRDVTERYGQHYSAAAVGEVNVVECMKATQAVIGGEGNGGVIYPALHYGRDALAGVALFLSLLANKGMKCSLLRATYPNYVISKNKIELTPDIDVDYVLNQIAEKHKDEDISTIDGVKINFPNNWVHLRKSNTEPIIRIYSESNTAEEANALANEIIKEIKACINRSEPKNI
ncbi:MAG: phosphoglucosamine mutase [Bacteroidales bacterium]|jgi:phosphomannomutase|nr:phosphoglucosamine mutase [Bacteroidales bacterium]